MSLTTIIVNMLASLGAIGAAAFAFVFVLQFFFWLMS